ncbi:MAG TPA: hypothetical protein VHA05_00805 [Candidatus Saccharimonadales bacterium]|nr:hypothetical protein [Candidatus Saccharimonadales bacterium]
MLYDVVGWVGAALILIAYFLVSTKKISPVSKSFQLLNLLGAVGIVVNSIHYRAFPSAGLNIAWTVIAIYGLVRAFRASGAK